MNADMTVEEMLQTLCSVQNELVRNEWDRLMHMEEEPILVIHASSTEAA